MEFDAEFFVLLGFLVFVGVLVYFGAHRIVLKALDARGEAIAAELAQAAKLRDEATALLASFEKKTAEAEANAAAIVAERLKEFIARRTKQAEDKIALAEAQATAEVRAAAADHAAKAAEIVLTDQMHGPAGADLVGREIGDLKNRLS
jgi:F-type H+-transporting ATPase subunit b